VTNAGYLQVRRAAGRHHTAQADEALWDLDHLPVREYLLSARENTGDGNREEFPSPRPGEHERPSGSGRSSGRRERAGGRPGHHRRASGAASGIVEGSSDAVSAAFQLAEQTGQCATSGPLPGLSASQASNAETIVSVSDTLSHESARAAQIALMTSITELHLINVDVGEGGPTACSSRPRTPGTNRPRHPTQRAPPRWWTLRQELNVSGHADREGVLKSRVASVDDATECARHG